MTEIRVRTLSCTKINESETETENGTTVKYSYIFQDEDKENVITLKTEHKRDFHIGQTVDVLISCDQKKLVDFEKDYLPESVKNTPGAVEVLKEAKELVREMDEDIKQKKEQENPGCRFWYMPNMCANSIMADTICIRPRVCGITPEEMKGEGTTDHLDAKEGKEQEKE